MKYYNLIKLNRFIKSHRIKFLGLYGLHLLGRRYLAVHLDPVNACNLRCKMCYFTDKDYVKKLKGIIPPEEIAFLGNSFFKRAVKLQIGCGTEPTLYKELGKIIKEAKKHEVPYVSITTNANLIKEEELRDWAASGLSEITVSLHGVT
ncbi:MAG: radical SAM protein, partial [Flavobacteriaceae bacterium]|nr:radical SAM protein [Flavobacteriaceae bacterium]